MKFIGVLLLVSALLIAGTMDCQEAQGQADLYCDMVIEGTWPNYRDIDCEEDNGND